MQQQHPTYIFTVTSDVDSGYTESIAAASAQAAIDKARRRLTRGDETRAVACGGFWAIRELSPAEVMGRERWLDARSRVLEAQAEWLLAREKVADAAQAAIEAEDGARFNPSRETRAAAREAWEATKAAERAAERIGNAYLRVRKPFKAGQFGDARQLGLEGLDIS